MFYWENEKPSQQGTSSFPHYYGDIVRLLFLLSALVMFVGLPILKDYVDVPVAFSVAAILILALTAGLVNPKQIWSAWVNVGVSSIGFVVFGTKAITAYQSGNSDQKFFAANFILGILFLIAIYFSVKTVRGLLLKNGASTPQ